MAIPSEVWASGAAYEPFIGRWSRRVAQQFLAWLAIPPAQHWLEVGCGTGALSSAIIEQAAPERVTASDRSVGFAAYASAHIADPRAGFVVADAQSLPFAPGSFGVVVSGLLLNFVPDPHRAVAAMRRVTQQHGVVAAYVWDYAQQMQMLRYFWDAAVALDPDAAPLAEDRRFPLCNPDRLAELFVDAGLATVQTRAIDVPTIFQDFDDFWMPFLGGQGPAPGYTISLSEEKRIALRDYLRRTLPAAADGTIHLIARAWSVTGRSSVSG